jgi:hypothetical protein
MLVVNVRLCGSANYQLYDAGFAAAWEIGLFGFAYAFGGGSGGVAR